MYQIDRALARDVPQLPEIERRACELFLQDPVTAAMPLLLTPLADFEAAQREERLWVARAPGGEPVGFALVERLGAEPHLEELDVLPEHGRRGIGTALVRAVCAWAAVQPGGSLTLSTFRHIAWNAPFYRRLGFAELAPADLTPALRARMEEEAAHGLAAGTRVAMRWTASPARPAARSVGFAVAGSVLFFAAAPAVVAGWIPYLVTRWRLERSFFDLGAGRWAGAILAAAGTACLVDCFVRFAIGGRGTPAPVAPTERLVVSGLYRHVRNPMYLAVVSVILGQALLLGSRGLLAYAACVWLGFHLFVVLYEEPDLRHRFGDAYRRYQRDVRRWLPRRSPWTGSVDRNAPAARRSRI